ncbi:MAG: PSD1 and planctomycete cytochrome C domain-containing protein [Bryobacterales bacterium]|nr:PSD1 and planctomycete cytochrome C domain-containing protein [Bryobacterales bacterium]
MLLHIFLLAALSLAILPPFVLAQSPEDVFTAKVQPALREACSGCHGETMQLSKLDLRSREAMLKGGLRGPALVPGDAAKSPLYLALKGEGGLMTMPPGGASKGLPPETIEAIRAWIDGGAPWVEAKATGEAIWSRNFKPEDLWAFQAVPPRDRSQTIDAFVHRALAAQGIAPAPRADRRTLIRRIYFDLTGLPPAPAEVEAFVADKSPRAWLDLVERLLASPRYGERWARHWLDVVRFADTGGYSNDFERPNAWRYRDYVIRSLNNDKPYDQFVREQLAGDELYPDDPEAHIATGFLRTGPWEHTGMSVEAVTRQMFLDDVAHTAVSTFQGLTLGCARCHDHKFDPIPTKDYYRVQAVFASTEFARPALAFLRDENTGGMEAGRRRLDEILARTNEKYEEFRKISVRAAMKELGIADEQALPEEVRKNAVREGKGLSPEDYEAMKLFQKHLQIYRESRDRFEPKAFAVSSGPLDGFTDGGDNLKYPKRAAYQPASVHILPGGNIQAPAEKVEPGALSAVERYGNYALPKIPDSVEGRRSALALWIADARNPLTARVMVNRIWQYHFGKGIAADPSNFGKMGAKPTHPELLDWLAAYFVEQKWSIKQVHRAILLSETYQQASQRADMAEVVAKDPENKLLAYFPPRRAEAEVLRDSILAVSGELSLAAGGPGVFPQINEDVARQPQHRMGSLAPPYFPSPKKSQRNRRSIYTFQQRSLIDPLVDVFNGPSLDLSCERRESSIVPTQAFALFNSQFVNDMALAFALRLEREASSLETRIERGFLLAFGRAPSAEESRLAKAHVENLTAHHRAQPAPPRPESKPIVHTITSELTGESFRFVQQEDPVEFEANVHVSEVSAETLALADFTLALLNANEFAYLY